MWGDTNNIKGPCVNKERPHGDGHWGGNGRQVDEVTFEVRAGRAGGVGSTEIRRKDTPVEGAACAKALRWKEMGVFEEQRGVVSWSQVSKWGREKEVKETGGGSLRGCRE